MGRDIEILNSIEDIVAANAESPDKLSIELEGLKSSYSVQDIREALNNESLFGDPKLTAIIRDYFSSTKKPLDNAYIKSLDFCECEVCEAIKDVEKMTYTEDIFRTTMMEPIFLTDSGTLKHELVKDFEFPKILLTGDEILQSNDIAELCSPTVISMIAHCNDKEYTEDMTMKEFLEYITEIKNFSESALGQILSQSGDFGLMNRIRSTRGVQYLSALLRRRSQQANRKNSKFQKPKGMSLDPEMKPYEQWLQEGDFDGDKVTVPEGLPIGLGKLSGNADGYGIKTGIGEIGKNREIGMGPLREDGWGNEKKDDVRRSVNGKK